MTRISRFVKLSAVGLVAAAFVAVGGAGGANATTFSGQATGGKGSVAGVPITLADTGPLAPEGGALDATLLCYPGANCAIDVPDLTGGALQAEVLHASTVAHGSKSRAEASVAQFGLNASGQSVSADFLMANAEASCNSGLASVTGGAEVAHLVVNGQTIDVSGQPNQQVSLPGGGVVVINEQVASASANQGEITVNALHIVIPGVLGLPGTDLIVAQAHADILCAPTKPPCDSSKDFVTGGGWIDAPSGGRANFAVAGGIKNGSFWGHLNYIDHGTGMKAKGTGVTAYVVTGPTSRHIEGTAEVNGASGYTYQADVADNGEPGRGSDDFKLQLFGPTPYIASG